MWILFWIFLSVLLGVYASSKKRSGLGWFFLSLIISPLIAFIIVLVAGVPRGTLKKCPKCAEEINVEAQICRFCGYEFPSSSVEESLLDPKEKRIDNLRTKFNEISPRIMDSKSLVEKTELRRERDKTARELKELRGY